jgi:hypothetical protein
MVAIKGTMVVFAIDLARRTWSLIRIQVGVFLLVCVVLVGIHQGTWLMWCRVVPGRVGKAVPVSKMLIT